MGLPAAILLPKLSNDDLHKLKKIDPESQQKAFLGSASRQSEIKAFSNGLKNQKKWDSNANSKTNDFSFATAKPKKAFKSDNAKAQKEIHSPLQKLKLSPKRALEFGISVQF